MEEKDYYKVKAVSSHSLGNFKISPLYFKKKLDRELEEEPMRFLEKGKKVHMKLLEPDLFEQSYIYLDFDKPKSQQQLQFCEDYISSKQKLADDKALEAYKKNYSSTGSDDKVKEKAVDLKKQLSKYITYLKKRTEVKDVLNKSDYDWLMEAERAVKNHKKANELLFPETNPLQNIFQANEFQIYWESTKHKLPCKSALDRVIIDHDNKVIKLMDIKTTSSLSKFKDSFDEFKYYRQLAFYWLALYWHITNIMMLDITNYKYETYIIAIQTGDPKVIPTECRVFPVNETELQQGFDEIESILSEISWHWHNDQWEYSKQYYEGDGVEILC